MSPRRSIQMFGRSVPLWALALVVAAIAGGVLVLSLTGDAKPRLEMTVETFEVGDSPQDLDVFDSVVWVVNGGDQTAQRISTIPMETEPDRPVRLGTLPGQVAIADDAIWIGAIEGDEITRIGPDGPRSVRVGRTPQSVTVGPDAIWVASFDDGSLWRISPEGQPAPEEFPLEGAFPSALATGFGSVWITDVVSNNVLRVDEATGEVTDEIPVGDSPTAIAVGEGGVWVANYNDATVTHIDPETNSVVGQAIIVGARPGGIATGDGSVWVTRPESDSVIRIDPLENEWTGEVFGVGDAPQGIAVGAGSVWTADQGSDTVTRLTPKEQQD
ncbi:MAG: hypothetical protein ACLGIB_10975 [Actinomycetota bacterium]